VVLLQTKPFLLFEFSLLFSFCFVEGVREGEFWACFVETRKERGELLFLRATAASFLIKKREEYSRGRERGVPATHHEGKFNLNSLSLRGGVLMVVVRVGLELHFKFPIF